MNRLLHSHSLILKSWIMLVLLALVWGGGASADSVTFSKDSLIDTSNTSYENFDVTVTGCTVTINGSHAFHSLHVTNNGLVTHAAGLVGGLNLTVTTNLSVDDRSRISATGKGFPSASGPGAGHNDRSGGSGGGGASYGGEGQNSGAASAGTAYGDSKSPSSLGSGGGYGLNNPSGYPGFAGGGAVLLLVNGTLHVDGQISADSDEDSGTWRGGGSGGSVNLTVGTLEGTGKITARGGGYYNNLGGDSGAGGGGRIAINYTTNGFAGTISAAGGGTSNHGWAGAGTIFLRQAGQAQGDLIIDNENDGTNYGTVLVGNLTFDNLTVRNQGVLTAPKMSTVAVTVVHQLVVEKSGHISANGRGFPGSKGPGAGQDSLDGNSGGGGASFGGQARPSGSAGSGNTYGDITNPVDLGSGENLGSGGGYGVNNPSGYPGFAGGGAVLLTVNGTLHVDGQISADSDEDSNTWRGGGSGGSVNLTVGTLEGTGKITARGGGYYNNLGGDSGAGGGGRIAINYTTNGFAGTISAAGGGTSNHGWAGAGTIFLRQAAQAQGDLIIDNSNNDAHEYGTPLLQPVVFDNITIRNKGKIVALPKQLLDITVLGNLNVTAGGWIMATGAGYRHGDSAAIGAGGDDHSGTQGGAGGSYGGWGNGASGLVIGPTYGSDSLPMDFGSPGGNGYRDSNIGYPGGGAIRLRVNGTLTVDGEVSANGVGDYGDSSGGGSGGSVLIRAGMLAGAGTISAYGGGFYNRITNYTGAGGGGRAAIYYGVNSFAGTYSAHGGYSDTYGWAGDGTANLFPVTSNLTASLSVAPTALAGGQTATGVITLSDVAPAGGISIALTNNNPSAVSVPPSVSIDEGATSATFPITANSVSVATIAKVSAQLWDQTSSATLNILPWLAALKINPTAVVGGGSITGTLTLNIPAPGDGLTIGLAASDPAIGIPAQFVIPGGAKVGTFTGSIGTVTTAKAAKITATYLAERRQTNLILDPAGVRVRAVAISPGSVIGGQSATGIVTLSAPAPAGGALIALTTSNVATAPVPIAVTVPAGKTSTAFPIPTFVVASQTSVLITATLGGTVMTTLTVRVAGIASLSLVPNVVTGGETSIGIVTLETASASPVIVTISSSKAQAIPDQTLVIPPGQLSGAFNIDTLVVTSPVSAIITVRANNTSKSQVLTINN